MDKWDVVKRIQETGIIAILRGTASENLLNIADALYAGGVRVLEITCNTQGYLGMIEKLASKMNGKMIIGAGTVLNPIAAQLVIDAGADFVLAPDFNKDVIQLVHQNRKLIIPGVTTATEILSAYRLGVDLVKLFPAGALGVNYLKNLLGPLNNAAIIPVGGITLDNIGAFTKAGAFAFGVGGELIDKKAILEGNYAVIEEKAKGFIDTFRQAKGY